MPVSDRVRLRVARPTNRMKAIVHGGLLSEVHLKHSCFISLGVIGGALAGARPSASSVAGDSWSQMAERLGNRAIHLKVAGSNHGHAK